MSRPVVEVQVRAVLEFNSGRAIFVGNEEKVFVIYVDESVGAAITMFMNDTPKERPLTHDLISRSARRSRRESRSRDRQRPEERDLLCAADRQCADRSF